MGSISGFKGVHNEALPSQRSSLKWNKNCPRIVRFAECPEASLVSGSSCASTWFKGFCSNLFMVPKSKRGIHPLLDLKSISKYLQIHKFLHGIGKVGNCLYKTKELHGICRHLRCLSTCSYLSTPSVFSAFHSGSQSFLVCHTALWPILCSHGTQKVLISMILYADIFEYSAPLWSFDYA